MGDRPTLPPPRKRPKPTESADSFPALAPAESNQIWELLKRLDGRLDELDKERGRDLKRQVELREQLDEHAGRLSDHARALDEMKAPLKEASKLVEATRELNASVIRLLEHDNDQEKRIAQIEVRAARAGSEAGSAAGVEAGSRAGHRAGSRWGGAMTLVGILIGSAVSAGVNQCATQDAKTAQHPGQ